MITTRPVGQLKQLRVGIRVDKLQVEVVDRVVAKPLTCKCRKVSLPLRTCTRSLSGSLSGTFGCTPSSSHDARTDGANTAIRRILFNIKGEFGRMTP